jgi:hypothetical protein
MMQKLLREKYKDLQRICGLNFNENDQINYLIKKAICSFVQQCNNPAIWCYGKHTKMLMSDFMFELKKVHFIIDNGIESGQGSGFEIIHEGSIVEKRIDGIIISSRLHRDDIINNLKKNYGDIPYLDIYDVLEKNGYYLSVGYYVASHPYSRYAALNKLQRAVLKEKNKEICEKNLKKIIDLYIEIKDFKSALKYADKLGKLINKTYIKKIYQKLNDIYQLQLETIKVIDEDNVIMLCLDGLRRKDISEKYMGNLYKFIEDKMCFFSNAYAASTSTYESLIPTYSENDDLRTGYFKSNIISSDNCRFIKEAKNQKREIFFYTDGIRYVKEDSIKVKMQSQTATEKLWDFILDASDVKNGLFYIHVLYESHYSYPNPYTTDEIITEGTNIMFDYLDNNGGQIRTDYSNQKRDSLRYMDDVMVPLLEELPCRIVLYADHGNILIDRGTDLKSVEKTKYTFHEDLIQVPLAIKAPEIERKIDNRLISIMDLNNIVIALMRKEKIRLKENYYVKVLRSEIYNPDFKYLYKKADNEQGLLAFEVFIFGDGHKLAVYSDGMVELYCSETDTEIFDVVIKKKLWEAVKDKITVCNKCNI